MMWRCERHRMALGIDSRLFAQRVIADAQKMSELELGRRMDCLGYLADQYREIGSYDVACPFWGFAPERIIPGEEIGLQQIFQSAREWARSFVRSTRDFDELLGTRTFGLVHDDAVTQLRALNELVRTTDPVLPLELVPKLFSGDRSGAQPAPVEPMALDGHLALAAWNRQAQRALEEIGAPLFSLTELTPEKGRSLKRSYASVTARLATAISALNSIQEMLPTLADVLARIAEHPARDLDTLLPWNWRPLSQLRSRAA